MNKKELLQKVFGNKGTESIIHIRNQIRHVQASAKGMMGEIYFSSDRPYTEYKVLGKNLFFGYYDLAQYNQDMSKMLAHIVPKNGDPSKDNAELVWIDTKDKSVHTIVNTNAWSWQQGSRLRWHPFLADTVLYNDYEKGQYVTKQFDIATGKNVVLCRALYDVDHSMRYGLSLNFDRLQRLRPGYGYSCQKDDSINDSSPEDDGVFLISLKENNEKLLFSLKDLAQDIHSDGVHHYINHLSISPNGKRFMFFHLWTTDASAQWNMRFYVANIDGSELKMLEDDVRVSHYCWIDDEHLMATRRVVGKEFRHVVYDLTTGKTSINQGNLINKDGHPSIIRNGFLTDTYPQGNMYQYIYLSNLDGTYNTELLHLFGDPVCYGEHRCDLHPRVFNENHITFDTTFNGKLRSIVAFDLTKDEIDKLDNNS